MLECTIHKGTLLQSWTRCASAGVRSSLYCPKCSPDVHDEHMHDLLTGEVMYTIKLASEIVIGLNIAYGKNLPLAAVDTIKLIINEHNSSQQNMQSNSICTCSVPILPIGGNGCELCGGRVETVSHFDE